MTTDDFVAGCFWPLAILFGLLLAIVREASLRRYVVATAKIAGVLCIPLFLYYIDRTVVAIVDLYVLAGVFGLAAIGYGYNSLGRDKSASPVKKFTDKLVSCSIILFGVFVAWISATTLFMDFAQPRLVLEGRADNLRLSRGWHGSNLVDIAGRTVSATAPVYQSLKSRPYVRVEVGSGSNVIFGIEYLDK
jgi:hypothetical protein